MVCTCIYVSIDSCVTPHGRLIDCCVLLVIARGTSARPINIWGCFAHHFFRGYFVQGRNTLLAWCTLRIDWASTGHVGGQCECLFQLVDSHEHIFV